MIQDEFTKIFTYVSHQFEGTDQSLAELNNKLNDIRGMLDTCLVMAGVKLDGNEKWASQAAEKLGV